MDSRELETSELVPIKLQLRVLRCELERLEEDLNRLSERHSRIRADISRYEDFLARTRRRGLLRRVK